MTQFIDYSEPLLIARQNLNLFEDALLHGRQQQAKEYATLAQQHIGIAADMALKAQNEIAAMDGKQFRSIELNLSFNAEVTGAAHSRKETKK